MSRQINPDLAQAKLSVRKVQLAQIENRIISLKAKLAEVVAKRDVKVQELIQLGTTISTTQNSTVVS